MEHTFGNHSLLLGPTGKPVVKIFIFADKKAYDLIVQDEEVNRTVCRPRLSTPGSCCSPHVTTCCSSSIDIPCKILALQGRFHGLHLLDSPELCFPSPQDLEKADNKNVSGSEWPVFTVALLEAGGPPLLSPPNVQHVVCAVVGLLSCELSKMSSLVAVLGQGSYFAELRYGGGASSLRAVPGRGCVLPQPREQLGGTPDIVRLRKGRLAERGRSEGAFALANGQTC